MNEKTKKGLMIGGLAVVGLGLLIGIGMRFQKAGSATLEAAESKEPETEAVMDIDMPDETAEKEMKVTIKREAEIEEESELVIEPSAEESIKETAQDLQETPVKTEEKKPEEPPTANEDAVTNSETEPVYNEDTIQTSQESKQSDSTPKHGDKKDGMIYIDGFGWIVDEGGGGSGTVAEDMYENGNKIGIMD